MYSTTLSPLLCALFDACQTAEELLAVSRGVTRVELEEAK
jgi:hypothetical protein